MMRKVARKVKRVFRPSAKKKKWEGVQGEPKSEHGREPPPTPDGWTVGPPDFIGLGAQKAGTTWWWQLIARHPDMVSGIKETHQLTRLGYRPLFDSDLEHYHAFFPRREGSVVGEWTPRYMTDPAVVDAVQQTAPNAKFIVTLRDPVDRYRSGIGQWKKRKERRNKRLNLWAARKDAYKRSFYGFQLQPYFDRFGADKVLVLQFEACMADPATQYARTLEFLGLSPFDLPPNVLGRPVNVARKKPTAEELGERPNLVAELESDVTRLKSMAPDLDLRLWPNFAHLDEGPPYEAAD